MEIPEIRFLPESKVTEYAAAAVYKNWIIGLNLVDPRTMSAGVQTRWVEDAEAQIPYAGKITHWTVRKYTGLSDVQAKLKIIYKHGTLYDCEGESSLEVLPLAAGLYKFDCDINVAAGRYLGIYLAAYIYSKEAKTGRYIQYYTGDLTGTDKTKTGQESGYVHALQAVLRY